ncbi:MAG: hypothetical protein AVDCRST_MAG91-3494, partial [uncultured Sphingomonadaceae bacterium]
EDPGRRGGPGCGRGRVRGLCDHGHAARQRRVRRGRLPRRQPPSDVRHRCPRFDLPPGRKPPTLSRPRLEHAARRRRGLAGRGARAPRRPGRPRLADGHGDAVRDHAQDRRLGHGRRPARPRDPAAARSGDPPFGAQRLRRRRRARARLHRGRGRGRRRRRLHRRDHRARPRHRRGPPPAPGLPRHRGRSAQSSPRRPGDHPDRPRRAPAAPARRRRRHRARRRGRVALHLAAERTRDVASARGRSSRSRAGRPRAGGAAGTLRGQAQFGRDELRCRGRSLPDGDRGQFGRPHLRARPQLRPRADPRRPVLAGRDHGRPRRRPLRRRDAAPPIARPVGQRPGRGGAAVQGLPLRPPTGEARCCSL